MNTELHVNDLMCTVFWQRSSQFVQIGAEVDCESAIQPPLWDGCIQWRQSQWLVHVLTPGPDCTSEPNFLFESDQVYGMDFAMFLLVFEVTGLRLRPRCG